MKNKKKWFFPFLAFLLLAPLSIVFVHDNQVVTGSETVRIEVTEPAAAPGAIVPSGAMDGVSPEANYNIILDEEIETKEVTLTLETPQTVSFESVEEVAGEHKIQIGGVKETTVERETSTLPLENLVESEYTIEHRVTLKNECSGAASRVALRVALLTTREPYQEVTLTNVSLSDYKVIKDKYGNTFAEFKFSNVGAGEEMPVKITYHVAVTQSRYHFEPCEDSIPTRFLKPERLIESNAGQIVDLAEQLTKDKLSHYEQARAIYDWIGDNISYTGYSAEDEGALFALRNRGGDCTEFSYLMIALCRAAGIPARFVEGLSHQAGTAHLLGLKHDWVEVLLPDIGWVPVDPTWGRFEETRDQYFARLNSDRIIVTTESPVLIAKWYTTFHYFEYRYWWDAEKAKLSHTESWQTQQTSQTS